ncbi:hypothetical protein ET475_06500 [Microbacterium protaetiae]|uniref:HlyD family efflux transporter periplasmic adaptor subunit n=1 Tax=Microbacterium protaetiae TaxID=2509458 RepID=A0A4P6EDA2_9MICO|nr:hypothetical protein [Microbacterium protaetiae]QAY59676.1 hypothetical protein ET475_06500 [Microbacterium protaetiae]
MPTAATNDLPAHAVADVRTITDVMTIPATVVAGTDYAVTAPEVGTLRQRGTAFTFEASKGSGRRKINLANTVTTASPIVPLGIEVGKGTPVLAVHDTSLTLRAAMTPTQVLRQAQRTPSVVRAQIDGSRGPFTCTLNDPLPTEQAGNYELSCRIPTKIPSVVGATGVLALTLAERADVVALPLEAVAGTRDKGSVYLPGSRAPHPVSLGITDGAYIEITKGLAAGDIVLIPSPSILDAQ